MMTKFFNFRYIVMLMSIVLFVSCSDDDDDGMVNPPTTPELPEFEGRVTIYDLVPSDGSESSGTATFTENEDNSVTIDLDVSNTPSGVELPAHIHVNSAAEDGEIVLTLGPVDGSTGKSSITVTAFDDGAALTYNDLITYDGSINVHRDDGELFWTVIAQGDIGENVLTGMSKAYDLNEKAAPGISGTVTFYERLNGEALSVIELMNTPEDGVHPAHIHNNSAIEGGGIAFSFNPVDGNTGISKTHMAQLDDGTAFGYDEIENFDGYINVHLSAEALGTIVAQGDIGQNELTGVSLVYELAEKDVAGISGDVTFYQRNSGEALALLSIQNTPAGGIHPAHIHNNDVATGGGIAFSFNPVNGDTGMSYTHVSQLDDGTSFVYADIDSFMGYINVHLSADQLGTIVAQGNIGASINDGGVGTTISYSVGNSGNSAYLFTGEGLENESNPDLTLQRGATYEFDMNTPGHPFLIKTVQTLGTDDAYNDGVTNNGGVEGKVTFTVPMDAPDTLFYICEFHAGMTGTLTIID